VFLRQRGVNVYRCPVCSRRFRYDDEYEPMCTGPGATDDHPMTVMVLEGVSVGGYLTRVNVPRAST